MLYILSGMAEKSFKQWFSNCVTQLSLSPVSNNVTTSTHKKTVSVDVSKYLGQLQSQTESSTQTSSYKLLYFPRICQNPRPLGIITPI